MGLQVQIAGTLVAGPAQSTDTTFPSTVTNEPFNLNPANKSYNVTTGMNVVSANSPSSFETLPGIGGAVGPVTQAKVLYLRTVVPMQFRITYTGDATPKVRYVNGISIEEVDLSHTITLVEVQGAGVVSYWACGDQ
jgi:hypothetical protein